MPPKKGRPVRQAQTNNAASQALDPQVVAKRTKRHLDELERSNYTEPSTSLADILDEQGEEGGKSARGRARQVISDKRGDKKKKSTMNIRTALLYRKNLATLIDESGIASLPSNVPTYLTAIVPRPNEPPRLICSICGYWGTYRCKRCAMPYCDMNCEGVHNETRCERRVV